MRVRLTDESTNRGGSLDEWRAVALDVLDNKYQRSEKGMLESVHIGLSAFPELTGAADRVLKLLGKKEKKK